MTEECKGIIVSNGLIATIENLIASLKNGKISEKDFLRINREILTVAEDMLIGVGILLSGYNAKEDDLK